jgi:hypothetical protein
LSRGGLQGIHQGWQQQAWHLLLLLCCWLLPGVHVLLLLLLLLAPVAMATAACCRSCFISISVKLQLPLQMMPVIITPVCMILQPTSCWWLMLADVLPLLHQTQHCASHAV